MFDLNTIISQALTQAVEQATKPLIERITALESQALAARIAALEESSPIIVTSENVMRHFESVMETTNRRIDGLEAWREDAITGDQVNHLIEEALNEIDWNEQVQEVLSGDMLEEAINDAIDEMLSELRIARR
jgi:hypothetical protein